ncbi:MAG: thioredoxin family protein [Verrucomicrobia bacterium]|nr:thioredoxin family protein [Verrucomicrobiota bacterium]MBV8375892.1 thioredoxin family protein [Verrucomicrobiota bacterium]
MIRRSLISALVCFSILASAAILFAAGAQEKGPRPLHIAFGQEVDLKNYLVKGKTTVFDFYSDYCPPCRALSPSLDALHEKRDDIAVVVVDINRPGVRGIDWSSPVAREFQLQSIPHLLIYNKEGELEAQGEGARAKVLDWIQG